MQPPFISSSKKVRLAFWFALLFVALITQFLLRVFIKKRGMIPFSFGELTTGVALGSMMSLIYGRILLTACCKCNENSNGQEASANVFDGDAEGNRTPLINSADNPTNNLDGTNNAIGDDNEESESMVGGTIVDTAPTSVNENMSDTVQNEGDLPQKKRMFYLDNLKAFLTFLVVAHHSACAFGACGTVGWMLIVGAYDNYFKKFADCFVLLNQGYFMSLFFFISAYFVPTSLERKGEKAFLHDKAKRYWIPAFFVTTIMAPLTIIYCLWFVQAEMGYFPTPFHCWFLYWLLLLNLAYVHIRGPITDEDGEQPHEQKLPGPSRRLFVYGLGICGGAMLLVIVMLQSGSFGAMPLVVGSLCNDLLFFAGGTVARKHGWLEKQLVDQIGMPVLLLRGMVFVEAVVMCYLFGKTEENKLYGVPAMLVAGIYCVDMSLALLEFFQTHLDFQNRFTKFLSDAAYTVYIVHPVFIVGVTSAWVAIYESHGNEIEWTGLYSTTPIEGGSVTLGIGYLTSTLLVNILVWPFSWCLRQLPGLQQIL